LTKIAAFEAVSTQVLNSTRAREILGLAPGADDAAIRMAFRRKALEVHPDRPGGTVRAFQQALAAFQLLSPASPKSEKSRSTSATATPRPLSRTVLITPAQCMLGGRVETELASGRRVAIRVPAGLRTGDRVKVSGEVLSIAVQSSFDHRVLGHDLWIEVSVDRRTLLLGGRIEVPTPLGVRRVKLRPGPAARRVIRLNGGGLPARETHPEGHLVLMLKPTGEAPRMIPMRERLRNFTKAWAA
jgi:curved DNA-binding protein